MTVPAPSVPDYELLRPIGRGSYGEIWLGRSVTGQYRAVKLVYRDRFESGRPFDREFAGIQRFEGISHAHPSQLDIFHVGRNDGDGFFFYVMELADDATRSFDEPGTSFDPEFYEPLTLKTVLERRGHLPVGDVLDLAESLAEALQHLHVAGLIHRDVKPSNIIFVRGRPKLADIGLITVLEESRSFVGTEGFVPREGPGSVSADLFALGKVIYEAATGRDRMEFPRLPEKLEEFPNRPLLMELNEVWLKACDPEPRSRYAAASEMRNDLALLNARKSVRRLRSLERQVRRGRKLVAVSLVAGLLITYGWWQSHRFNRLAAAQLAHVYVQNGQERLEHDDTIGALPWFAAAMKLEDFDARRERVHRLQLANVLASSPQLIGLHVYSENPLPRYVFFDAPARLALVCDPGHTARVWDLDAWAPISPPLDHGGQVRRGWFNAGSTRVATLCDDGFVRLWDAQTGKLKGTLIAHGGHARAACFSADGSSLFTAGSDGRIAAWDDQGQPRNEGRVAFSVSDMVASPDGRWLATAGDESKQLAIFDTRTLGKQYALGDLLSGPVCIAFDADSRQVAFGLADGSVRVWRFGHELQPGQRFDVGAGLFKLAFFKNGRRLLAGAEHEAGVFDLRTERPCFPILDEVSAIRVLELSPDEKEILVAGESRTARVLDAETGLPRTPPLRQAGEIALGRFTGSGREWMTSSADRTTRRWAMPVAERSTVRLEHSQDVAGAWLLPGDETALTIDVDGIARQWTWASNCVRSAVSNTGGRVLLAELSNDEQTLVILKASHDVAAWDVRNGRPIAALKLDEGDGSSVMALNPRRPLTFVAGWGRPAILWNWQTGESRRLRGEIGGGASHATFSPDGKLLAMATSSSRLAIWRLDDPDREAINVSLSDRANFIAFSRDGGRLLAADEDRSFKWLNPYSGRPLSERLRAEAGVNFARVSPDGTRVFTAGVNFEAMTWETSRARPLARPFRPHGQIMEAAFSPDADQVALISRDGAVQVWHAESGEPIGPILHGAGRATGCAFSRDGKWLLVVEDRRIVELHPQLQGVSTEQTLVDQAALVSSFRLDRDGLPEPLDAQELSEIFARRGEQAR